MNPFVIVVVCLLGVILLGAVYQALSAASDRHKFPPPGKMVDVGGHRLHLQVTGDAHGGPTVILEAGMASFSSNWAWVQQILSRTTRVVAYDRAGLGWSDPVDSPRDAKRSAEELHIALEKLAIKPPYIFVGHSYGGLVVRAFRELYPHDVVGLMLVDSSHPDQWTFIPASNNGKNVALGNRFSALLARLGVLRLMKAEKLFGAHLLPDRAHAEMKAMVVLPQLWEYGARGLDVWDSLTRPFINNAQPLGALPLSVLSVSEQPRYGETLTKLQNDLPLLSSNSEHEIVDGATHENLVAKEEYAVVVANAIQRVMQAAQKNERLTSLSGAVS